MPAPPQDVDIVVASLKVVSESIVIIFVSSVVVFDRVSVVQFKYIQISINVRVLDILIVNDNVSTLVWAFGTTAQGVIASKSAQIIDGHNLEVEETVREIILSRVI